MFGNSAYADWHPDYPLLVPALEAFAFRFGVGVRVVHLEFWLLFAAFAVSLLELLRPRVGPLFAWSAVLAIVWTPKVGAEAVSGNADMPLAVFLILAAVAAWLWVAERDTAALGLWESLALRRWRRSWRVYLSWRSSSLSRLCSRGGIRAGGRSCLRALERPA